MSTVDQGHLGLYAVITPSAIWASRSSGLNDVQRIDPKNQSAIDWFVRSRQTLVPIGLDADGSPVVAGGKELASAQIAATQIWIVPKASTGELIYSDAAHPLTIVGWPIVSAGALWIETDKGLAVEDSPGGQIRFVSSYSGYIAGGCL